MTTHLFHWSEFAAYKQNHEDLPGQVKALQDKRDSGQATITFELLHFLKVWRTRHINEADKRCGACRTRHQIQSTGRWFSARAPSHIFPHIFPFLLRRS
jgi:hemerythrin